MALTDLFIPAVVNFADPVMLIGVAAAGIPVALHLLNRMRSPVMRYSSLRFLRITAEKTARRRRLQHWLLLLLRMALFMLLAMVVAGPLVHGGSAGLAYGFLGLLVGAMLLAILGALALGRSLDTSRRAKQAVAEAPPGPGAAPPAANKLFTALSVLLLALAAGAAAYGFYGLAGSQYFHGSGGHYNGRSTACVFILDNSQSMLVQQNGRSRLDRAVRQTSALLRSVIRPATAAILLTNPGSQKVPRALSNNIAGMLGGLLHVKSEGSNISMQALVGQAVMMLRGSSQPDKMIVILSDMARHAFANAAVFSALRNRHIRLVLAPPVAGPVPQDIGITGLKILRGHNVVGSHIVLSALVRNNGDGAVVRRLGLTLDGQPVEGQSPEVQLGPGAGGSGRAKARLACEFTTAGWHVLTVHVRHANDAMRWDNQRRMVVHVHGQRQVLVVGNSPAIRSTSCAYYADAALAPFQGAHVPWSIHATYVSGANLAATALSPYRAIFLCNVAAVAPQTAVKLKHFVFNGGTLALLLGTRTVAASYNDGLLKQGLLPAAVQGPAILARGVRVSQVDTTTALLAHLFTTQTPFMRIVVTGRWALAPGIGSSTVMALADGSPFLVQEPAGRGNVYTLLSAPSGDWTNLANTSVFLPMLVRMALGPARLTGADASVTAGQGATITLPGGGGATPITVAAPDHGPVTEISTAAGPNRATAVYRQTMLPGVYQWKALGGAATGKFVVNQPGHEANLAMAGVGTLARENPALLKTFVVKNVQALKALLKSHGQGTSLMPGVLTMVLILVVLEALFANRYRPTVESTLTPAPDGASPEAGSPRVAA